MPVESLSGARYIGTFKDDYSGYRYMYTLKHKADVYNRFRDFERIIYNKFNRCMKVLHTDNGTEYCNASMKRLLADRGIQHKTTAPYTPQQNGRCERDNRTVIESACAMMFRSNTQQFLWAEGVNTAVYVLNMTSTNKMPDKTPFECWTNKKPDYSHLKVFSCTAYEHVPKNLSKKFEKKSPKVIFVGYEKESRNYRLYDHQTRKVHISRNNTFNEGCFVEEPKESTVFYLMDSGSPARKKTTRHLTSTSTEKTTATTTNENPNHDEGRSQAAQDIQNKTTNRRMTQKSTEQPEYSAC